ncbi:MAG: DUF2064 domain-containing protein [Methylotenera sp.]
MTQAALVLVCKRPAPGIGKQRLAARLGPEIAYQIAEALLACALEDVIAWPGTVVIAPADVKDYAWAASLLEQSHNKQTHADVQVLPQASGNLGQRLNALDHTLHTNGFNRLIYIGSDAPDISLADFAAVSEMLTDFDSVLKPTLDGGVSIMASRKPWPDLTDLPWSTSRLGDRLSVLCQQSGHSVAKLLEGFDVDELEDLSYLVVKLAQDQRPARQALCKLAQQIIQMKTSRQKVMSKTESRYV